MGKDRKRPGWIFWTTVALVIILIGYPLSFGPTCWMASRSSASTNVHMLPLIYWPIGRAKEKSDFARDVIMGYARIGMKRKVLVGLPIGRLGSNDYHIFQKDP